MKRITRVIITSLFLAVLFAANTLAIVPYSTYIYDIDGNMSASPHGFVADRVIDSDDLNLEKAMDANPLAGINKIPVHK